MISKDEKFCGRHTHARTRLSTRLNRNKSGEC